MLLCDLSSYVGSSDLQASDADNTVYLLGSFHLLKPDDYPLSSDVNDAFADAEAVVFEMPPEVMNSPQLPVQMMQAAVRTDGTGLDSELPPDTAARLRDWQAANSDAPQASGLTPERMQRFEPWLVGLMISIPALTKEWTSVVSGTEISDNREPRGG